MEKEHGSNQLYKEISRRDKIVFAAIIVLIFAVFQFGIKQICGFTVYPDELGYWASAAKAVGWDWSEIASLGSYYSFGYSVILTPILYFAPDSITAYQIAIFVNMLFMCIGFFLLCIISEKLFGTMQRTLRYLASGAAVLCPAWIFYMQTTLVEALLFSLFVFVICLFICFIEKPRVWTGVLLTGLLVCFYIIHMRTVGTMLACGITLILWGCVYSKNRKYVFIVLGLAITALIGAFYIKEFIQQSVYVAATTEELSVNDYAGKVENIQYIFSIEGFGRLLSHMAGKAVYWGVASLGLVYWAFAWMLGQIRDAVIRIKQKQEPEIKDWYALFLLLASCAQAAVSSVFYIRGENLDVYMNGRYIDFLVPVLIMTGLYSLYTNKHIWKKTLFFCLLHIMLTAITGFSVWNKETQNIRGFFQIGINWLLNSDAVDTRLHLIKIASAGVLFLAFVAFLVWFMKKKEVFIWIFSILMLVEMLIALEAGIQYTYYTNGFNYRELVLLDIVEEKCVPGAQVYYLDDGSEQWIDFIQMQMCDESIQVIKEENWEQEQKKVDILFAANNKKNKELYSSQFDRCVEESLLLLFYNTEEER